MWLLTWRNSLVVGILAHCLKRSTPAGYKPTDTDIRDVAQQIHSSYGLLSSGVHVPTLSKNIQGEIEIDTSNSTMCVPYQLGLKLHKLDPEIIVKQVSVAATAP